MKDIILNLNKKQKIICIVIILLILFAFFIYTYNNLNNYEDDEIILNNDINGIGNIQEKEKIGIAENEEKVIVHVIGEVNNPGVVTLDEGTRIIDAINAAGGKTEEADLSKVNLAYIVEDGTQIYIPRINENLNEIELMSTEAGQSVITNEEKEENGQETKVNINTANKEKLETLPGIGEATAQKIIDYRAANGKFKTIEEIKNVSGIGDAKFDNLKDKIVV